MREDYRTHAWQILCCDRPQHFAGTWQGVDRIRTLALLDQLAKEADALQLQFDNNEAINPDPNQDPRIQLKVLRLLLAGGLRNPE